MIMNGKINPKKIKLPSPHLKALRFFCAELALMIPSCVALLISFLDGYREDPIVASNVYLSMLEYITVSLTISVFFAVILDLTLLQKDKNESTLD